LSHPRLRKRAKPLPFFGTLLLTSQLTAYAWAEEHTPELLPSRELLLFLAEFDNVDDETFSLLVTRGEKDVAKQVNTKKPDNTQSKTTAEESKSERGDSNE
jgi:hypothetical protein